MKNDLMKHYKVRDELCFIQNQLKDLGPEMSAVKMSGSYQDIRKNVDFAVSKIVKKLYDLEQQENRI